MANKIYTSQEMREAAENITRVDIMDGLSCREHCYQMKQMVRAMLRQAADVMERKKKRKKNYEYSYRFLDGTVAAGHRENPRMVFGDPVHGRVLVRREVGEWEEVKDGE